MDGSGNAATKPDIKQKFAISDLRTFRNSNDMTYAIVGHNPDLDLICDTWIGAFDTEADFRQVLEYICECFETGDYRFWLADLRYLTSSFFHSDAWLAAHAYPRAIAAGLEREAVVVPRHVDLPEDYDVFGSASAALRKIADGRCRGFDHLDSAREWLLG